MKSDRITTFDGFDRNQNTQISMAFRQVLFNGGLALITILTLSIASNTKNSKRIDDMSVLYYNCNVQFFYEENILMNDCSIFIQINNKMIGITMILKSPCSILQIFLTGLKQLDNVDNADNVDNVRNQTIIPSYLYLDKDILWLDFTTESNYLIPGKYILKIIYSRNIIDNTQDLSPLGSIYPDETGDKILNAREFEVINSRDILPCVGYACKAIFNISIKYPSIYKVLSNMPIQKENIAEDDHDMQWVHYNETPLMSIDDIKIIITKLVPLVDSNVVFWCRKKEIEDVQYAKSIASSILQYFRATGNINIKKLNYVTITYGMETGIMYTTFNYKKYHNIPKKTKYIEGILKDKLLKPEDDEIKTRELVAHRVTDIIYNKRLYPFIHRIKVGHLIAKQITSLWYGTDVFLWSHGFATFYGAYLLDEVELKYVMHERVMDFFVVQIQQESFLYGTSSIITNKKRKTTHKVRNVRRARKRLKLGKSTRSFVVSESDLYYIKLFALWRMLQHLIPHNVFWTSIHTYAQTQYNYSNTTSDDLWTTMQADLNVANNTHKFDIKKVVNIWKKRIYPVLNVKRNYSDSTMEISYKFNLRLSNDTTENWIPVTYTTQSLLDFNNTKNFFWLNFPNQSYKIENINSNDWVLVNIKQIGYYRVNYDTENWLKLARYLNSDNYTKIHVINRAQIVDDAFYFWMKKELNSSMFWHIVSFLSQDASYIAWHPMIKAFEYMMCSFPLFHMQYITIQAQILLNRLLKNVGYYGNWDHDFTNCLREEVIKWACIFNIPTCINISTLELEKHFATMEKYSPLAWDQWTYCKGFAHENYSWKINLNKLLTDYRILEFFTCSASSQVFVHYWSHKDTKRFFSHVQVNKHANLFLLMIARHANAALKDILQKFEDIKPKKVGTIATLIVLITHMHDVFQLKQVLKFAASYLKEKDPINKKKVVEHIKTKIKRRKHEYASKVYVYMGSANLHNLSKTKFDLMEDNNLN